MIRQQGIKSQDMPSAEMIQKKPGGKPGIIRMGAGETGKMFLAFSAKGMLPFIFADRGISGFSAFGGIPEPGDNIISAPEKRAEYMYFFKILSHSLLLSFSL
jgi:hypothetical protein